MPDQLNVVALISGGKDSFFSLLHCIENGHNVVALANLYPPSPASHQPSDVVTDDESKLAETEGTDLNSFMYQTVGHSLIPLYSTALRLPLYRREIAGTSVQKSQYYDTSSSSQLSGSDAQPDETEDLMLLLRTIVTVHPEVNAVSTGAILSTYQRTRVESIAFRLGLVPLSYLWQYPVLPAPDNALWQETVHRSDSFTGLLQDFALSGLDSRIIKIASAGIPEDLLFANVADSYVQARLVSGLSPFFEDDDEVGLRAAVLGEGGEYETITLNGPTAVWKGGRIVLDETSNDSYTEEGVSYVRLGTAKVVPHRTDGETQGDEHYSDDKARVPVPVLLDVQFARAKKTFEGTGHLLQAKRLRKEDSKGAESINVSKAGLEISGTVSGDILELGRSSTVPDTKTSTDDSGRTGKYQNTLSITYTVTTSSITINNITAASFRSFLNVQSPQALLIPNRTDSLTVFLPCATQMETLLNGLPALFTFLSDKLEIACLSFACITSTTLILNSISDFALVNPIYARIWPTGLPNPPSRVTIAAPLEEGIYVSLSLKLDFGQAERRGGLHVQGRSYWAPANIGPYSQAISVPLYSVNVPRNSEDDVSSREDEEGEHNGCDNLQLVHIAGQIPLIPASMDLNVGSFIDTAILSLQHLWRIGQERKVDFWPYGVAYLSRDEDVDIYERVITAAAIWRISHVEPTWSQDPDIADDNSEASGESIDEETEHSQFDVWHVQHNRSLQQGFRQSQMSVGKHLHVLPNHSCFSTSSNPRQKHVPPFLAVQVTALPRNASIEWWSNGIAGFKNKFNSSQSPQSNWHSKVLNCSTLSWLAITDGPKRARRSIYFVSYLVKTTASLTPENDLPKTLLLLLHHLNDQSRDISVGKFTRAAQIVQGTAFVSSGAFQSGFWAHFTSSEDSDIYSSQTSEHNIRSSFQMQDSHLASGVNIVPCHQLWGSATSTVQAVSRDAEGVLRHDQDSLAGDVEPLMLAFLLRVECS